MEHMNPLIIDELLASAKPEPILLFLVDAIYSPSIGFFQDMPEIISLLHSGDSMTVVREVDSHILQPYIPRISSIINRSFSLVGDPASLILGVDKYIVKIPFLI
jgi:hypothetical protein